MSFAKTFTRMSLLAGAAAMSLVTLGSAAEAYDRGGHRDYRWRDRGHVERHYAPPRHYHYDDHDRRRRDKDRRVARGIAIGVGAVLLGTILAAEANRRNSHDYD